MKRALVLALIVVASPGHAAKHHRVAVAPTATTTQASALALAALDRKIADLDSEEQDAKKELASLDPQIRQAHGRAVTKGRTFYKLTRAGMLPVGGGFGALVDHAMHVERARHMLQKELDEEKRLRSHGADLASTLDCVARDRESFASQRTAMDAARIAMAEEQRRQQAFTRAFEGSGDYVEVGSGLSSQGAGFAASRGKLLFPVLGKADVRIARREDAAGPGLEILARYGTIVRSVYAGRVAFADRYGAYGRIVILDHGDHYYSVSGNLGTVEVKVGDEVSGGERIGTVGDEGNGPMMYLELRKGTETMPPAQWLGIEQSPP